MKKNTLIILSILTLFSCRTVPQLAQQGYYLPLEGERVIYLAGEHGQDFLEPMADSLGIEDYSKIDPLVERTDSFYLLSVGKVLSVQGRGDYNRTFINLAMMTSSDWSATSVGKYKIYQANSMPLQIAFPDGNTLLMSMGNIEELLSSYEMGGSAQFPFNDVDKTREALLISIDLAKDGALPLAGSLSATFQFLDISLSPMVEKEVLMDLFIRGEEGSGRQLSWAVKLFMVATFGQDGMKGQVETGNDFAGVVDYLVNYELIMDLVGL